MSLSQIKSHLENADHNWTIEEGEGALTIINEDGVTVYLAITEQQMIAESLLFKEEQIKEPAVFNRAMMMAQKGLPLSSVGITSVNGENYYCIFGALSSDSKLDNVELEIVLLFNNVTQVLQFSHDFL